MIRSHSLFNHRNPQHIRAARRAKGHACGHDNRLTFFCEPVARGDSGRFSDHFAEIFNISRMHGMNTERQSQPPRRFKFRGQTQNRNLAAFRARRAKS